MVYNYIYIYIYRKVKRGNSMSSDGRFVYGPCLSAQT